MAKMHKHRILFEKEGRAKFISHLDLMRTFPRAFLRAGLSVKQTEGYNKHSFVSIAFPLSLGYTSNCEILEFELLDDISLDTVPQRLNAYLPDGIRVLKCYEAELPFKQAVWLEWDCRLYFDNGVPDNASALISSCFQKESFVIQKPSKKSKKGYVELDLIPLIHSIDCKEEEKALVVHAVLAAQNPGLNPEVMLNAVKDTYDFFDPDFQEIKRVQVLNGNFEKFE